MSAGGAEREARELHDAIERAHEKWYDAGCHETGCGCVTVYVEREVMPLLVKFANEARLEALEQSLAIYQRAFEQNWVVQDTIDAIRALKAAPLDPPGAQHEN